LSLYQINTKLHRIKFEEEVTLDKDRVVDKFYNSVQIHIKMVLDDELILRDC
jgi:hypothetical protein